MRIFSFHWSFATDRSEQKTRNKYQNYSALRLMNFSMKSVLDVPAVNTHMLIKFLLPLPFFLFSSSFFFCFNLSTTLERDKEKDDEEGRNVSLCAKDRFRKENELVRMYVRTSLLAYPLFGNLKNTFL